MKKVFFVFVAVAIVVAFLFMDRNIGTGHGHEPLLPNPNNAALEAPLVDDSGAKSEEVTPVVRRELTSSHDQARGLTVRGRAVAAEDGEPIAGVRVQLSEHSRDDQPIDPVTVHTGADGRFEIAFTRHGARTLFLLLQADGRVALQSNLRQEEAFEPGHEVDLGDLSLTKGTPVAVRAVDEEGLPVEGFAFQIVFGQPSGQADGKAYSRYWFSGHTDRRGMAGPEFLKAGTAAISFPGSTNVHEYKGPSELEIPTQNDTYTIRLQVQSIAPARVLTGRVVDQYGHPLAGVKVAAKGGGPARTLHDGSFKMRRNPTTPVQILGLSGGIISGRDEQGRRIWYTPGSRLLEPLDPLPTDANDVRVVIERAATQDGRLHVLDGRTMNPLENFRIAVTTVSRYGSSRYIHAPKRPAPRYHSIRELPDAIQGPGDVSLPEISDEHHVVMIIPSDPGLQPVFMCDYNWREGLQQTVVVPPAVTWRVRIVTRDANGDTVPASNSDVEFRRQYGDTGEPSTDSGYCVDPDKALAGLVYRNEGRPWLRCARATTDANGYAALTTGARVDGCQLVVTGATHETVTQNLTGHVTMTTVIELEPQRAARLSGNLEPVAVAAELERAYSARLRLREVLQDGPQNDRKPFEVHVEPQPDGSFTLGPLRCADSGSDFELLTLDDRLLGEIKGLRNGEHRQLRFDISAFEPGQRRSRVHGERRADRLSDHRATVRGRDDVCAAGSRRPNQHACRTWHLQPVDRVGDSRRTTCCHTNHYRSRPIERRGHRLHPHPNEGSRLGRRWQPSSHGRPRFDLRGCHGRKTWEMDPHRSTRSGGFLAVQLHLHRDGRGVALRRCRPEEARHPRGCPLAPRATR